MDKCCIAERDMGYLVKGNEMKIPKITLNLLTAALLVGALATMLTPSTAEALTKAQKQACQDKWAGNFLSTSQKVKNYYKSNCPTSKGGNCTAMNHRVPTESGGEEVRTTITCPINSGGGGGDAPDDGTTAGCGELKTSIISCSTGGDPLIGMLLQVINFLAVGVGIAVVGGIIWGGLIYASSNGDSGKTKQAVTIIVNAVVGLLLFIFMYAFVNFLVPGGVFT
jgi:hypothetical protein